MNYQRVLQYLDAIAANANIDISNSPHGAFWKHADGTNLTYVEFTTSTVTGAGVPCHGNPVPIIDRTNLPGSASQSAFFLILTTPGGWCGKRAMPGGGPHLFDPGYQVTLPDGTTVTGTQITTDLATWLANGFPEN